MVAPTIFSISRLLFPQPQNRLSQNIGREDRERERHGNKQLARGQGNGAQNAAPEVDK